MLIPLMSTTGLVMVILAVLVATFAVAGIVRTILGARKEDHVRDTR